MPHTYLKKQARGCTFSTLGYSALFRSMLSGITPQSTHLPRSEGTHALPTGYRSGMSRPKQSWKIAVPEDLRPSETPSWLGDFVDFDAVDSDGSDSDVPLAKRRRIVRAGSKSNGTVIHGPCARSSTNNNTLPQRRRCGPTCQAPDALGIPELNDNLWSNPTTRTRAAGNYYWPDLPRRPHLATTEESHFHYPIHSPYVRDLTLSSPTYGFWRDYRLLAGHFRELAKAHVATVPEQKAKEERQSVPPKADGGGGTAGSVK
jgi:hypothetical protein